MDFSEFALAPELRDVSVKNVPEVGSLGDGEGGLQLHEDLIGLEPNLLRVRHPLLAQLLVLPGLRADVLPELADGRHDGRLLLEHQRSHGEGVQAVEVLQALGHFGTLEVQALLDLEVQVGQFLLRLQSSHLKAANVWE